MQDRPRPGILTLLEAARENPSLHQLRYDAKAIDALLKAFKIAEARREALWECLEGAAAVYERVSEVGLQAADVEAATKFVTKLKSNFDELILRSSVLEMFVGVGVHVGKRNRFQHLGVDDAVTFAAGLLNILYSTESACADSKDQSWHTSMLALKKWRHENAAIVARISAVLGSLEAKAIPQHRRADKKLAIKMWVLCLMHFWIGELGRSAPLTKDVIAAPKSGQRATRNLSHFNAFCEQCFVIFGNPADPNFRTAIAAARKHLDRETEIAKAFASGDFVRVTELTRTWKDRIPLAMAGKTVLDT